MIEHTPLETRLLLHLVTIADAGSLSKAAHLLGLTQPALSKSLRNAETKLGASIFHRIPGGLRPTTIGETILVHARQALLTIGAIEMEVRTWTNDDAGRIRIGCGPTIVTQLIETVLVEFMAEYPKVGLDVISGNPHDLAQSVETGDLDLMVGFSENLEGSDLLTQRPLRRDRLSFFSALSHPLAKKDTIAPSELARYFIALPFRTSKIDDWLEARAKEATHLPFRVMLCNDMSALTDLVENGLALSVGPSPFIERLAERRDVTPIAVAGFDFDRLLHCILPRGRPISLAVERLAALIEARMSNIVPARPRRA